MNNQYTYLAPVASTFHHNTADNPDPGLSGLLALFVIFFLFYLILIRPYYRFWKKLPTLEEYLRQHPHCKTSGGVKCVNCGSKSIRNWGHRHPMDGHRIHICNHCGVKLYRSESMPL